MVSSEVLKDLAKREAHSKIILLVIDGLGGVPHPDTGKTELETARTPQLDALARQGVGGLIDPIGSGITPGSGVAHLALFGYDPVKNAVGRGAIAAAGVGEEMQPTDVAVRTNFATMNEDGLISDRRAGRIPTERCAELCHLLEQIKMPGLDIVIKPVKDYRAVVIFKGEGLCPALTDSDPQALHVPPKTVEALSPEAQKMADIANSFIASAKDILKDQYPSNTILFRGFAHPLILPSMKEVYGLNAGVIATYPDYRGVARMVGMTVLDTGSEIADEMDTLEQHYTDYDFIFFHVKKTDSAGEDGDFDKKAHVIEELDALIPRIARLEPDVLIVTGDHSTPALLKLHSWHPVPLMLNSRWTRRDAVIAFGETECAKGSLGRFPATEVMALALAYAERLEKFSA